MYLFYLFLSFYFTNIIFVEGVLVFCIGILTCFLFDMLILYILLDKKIDKYNTVMQKY